jgi:single-strand DNA-binding protein
MDLNKVILVGRVTADPQIRTTPGGQSVTTIGVATNRTWTDKAGQKQEQAEFHSVVVWGRQAEIAGQYLTKGAMVLIEGRIATRGWTDKQGQARKTTEIMCERLQLGPRAAGGGGGGQGGGYSSNSGGGNSFGGSSSSGNQAPSGGNNAPAGPSLDEIPVINLDDEEEIKPEDIPF